MCSKERGGMWGNRGFIANCGSDFDNHSNKMTRRRDERKSDKV